MDRRRFVLLTSLAGVLTAPLAAGAQQPVKRPTIGYLADTPGVFIDSLRRSLGDLGYMEGRNIVIETRWIEGRYERLPQLVSELIQLKVDLMVTAGTQASLAAKQATGTIPIVMAHVGDPVGTGLVASLSRPGGNITGVSVMGPDLAGKQLELLRQAVPTASRVAVLVNPIGPGAINWVREIQVAASALGIAVQVVEARSGEDLANAFAAVSAARAEVLVVTQDQVFFSDRTRITDLATKHRLPAMYMYREWADAGGLMTYGGRPP